MSDVHKLNLTFPLVSQITQTAKKEIRSSAKMAKVSSEDESAYGYEDLYLIIFGITSLLILCAIVSFIRCVIKCLKARPESLPSVSQDDKYYDEDDDDVCNLPSSSLDDNTPLISPPSDSDASGDSDVPSDFSRRAAYGDFDPPSLPSSPPRTPSPPRAPQPHLIPSDFFNTTPGRFLIDPPPSPPRVPSPPRHAPIRLVEALPLKVYAKNPQKSDRCGICLEDYEQCDTLMKLPCLHEFHRDCVDTWLRMYNRDCPLCRGNSCDPTSLSASSDEGNDGDNDDDSPPCAEDTAED